MYKIALLALLWAFPCVSHASLEGGGVMLMAKRNMMASKRLPYDAEVEYLESQPAASVSTFPKTYIDTGILCDSPLDVSIDIELVSTDTNMMFFGSRSSTEGRFQFGSFTASPTKPSAAFGYRLLYETSHKLSRGVRNKFDVSYSANPIVYANGKRVFYTSVAEFSTHMNMWLFANNAFNSVYGSHVTMRVYDFTVKRSGVFLVDFMPVRFTNELGVSEGAMYDRVSGEIFRNKGTGAFIVGPDK